MKNQDVGIPPPDDAERDAIHVAIIPVVAGERLVPGQHVGRINATEFGTSDHPLGIVDPFLRAPVEKGQRFWLCLYPKTVESIRHHWIHEAFPEVKTELEKQAENVLSANLENSERWLKEYAENYYSGANQPYEALLEDLRNREIIYRGTDMHSRDELADEKNLKHHAEIVLGREINFDDFTSFSCTC